MKVGTDAVLLGAWVGVEPHAKRILDVGTGSGVIALMMAQRSGFDSRVDAVETDPASVIQARENVAASPWPGKIEVFNTPVQDFAKERKYDLIVCNPPFFSKSLLPPAQHRQNARHTETLSFQELIESVLRLLSPAGTFAVILPVTEGTRFRELAHSCQITCHRSTAFFSRQGKPQERWLMEFSFEGRGTPTEPETLVLYKEADQWSEGYKALTCDFYIR